MDALVSKKEIDPSLEFLDFDNLCITNSKENTYAYEKYPNISGIPLWMKEMNKFLHEDFFLVKK